jgi:hypothetical protein
LLRDVSTELVPLGDDPLPEEQHARFLDHMAAMASRMWGWHDRLGLLPHRYRWSFFSPAALAGERALGFPERVPELAEEGWRRFANRVPARVRDLVAALVDDPTALADAVATTPATFLHGDWKLGNLGAAADGRTVLLDWAYPGEGPAAHEPAWYLALNRARLPFGTRRSRRSPTSAPRTERREPRRSRPSTTITPRDATTRTARPCTR